LKYFTQANRTELHVEQHGSTINKTKGKVAYMFLIIQHVYEFVLWR